MAAGGGAVSGGGVPGSEREKIEEYFGLYVGEDNMFFRQLELYFLNKPRRLKLLPGISDKEELERCCEALSEGPLYKFVERDGFKVFAYYNTGTCVPRVLVLLSEGVFAMLQEYNTEFVVRVGDKEKTTEVDDSFIMAPEGPLRPAWSFSFSRYTEDWKVPDPSMKALFYEMSVEGDGTFKTLDQAIEEVLEMFTP